MEKPATCHLGPPPATWNESMAESMTEGRLPEPEPEPEHPCPAPDGWDPGPESGHRSQSSGFRSPFECGYLFNRYPLTA